MPFCSSIHCMDGRIQEPVIAYLKTRYHKKYVDAITEPGPNRILAEGKESGLIDSVFRRLRISVEHHKSDLIAISGHADCAGNPAAKEAQMDHIQRASDVIRERYPDIRIVKLWVNSAWEVEEIPS